LIDAATAAEVAVERALFSYFNGRQVGEEQIEAILKQFTGIAEKLRLIEKLEPKEQSLVRRVADRVAGPRNKATHGGWHPGQEVVDSCLEAVSEVLAIYDPLPEPHQVISSRALSR
jgi:hypothetical protein